MAPGVEDGAGPPVHPHARSAARTRPRSRPSRTSTRRPSIISKQAVGVCGYVAVGSSLKFCIVAEGKADIYPRAVADQRVGHGRRPCGAARRRRAGRRARRQPLRYGKRAFLNRAFVATAGWKAPPIGPFLEDFAGGGELPQGV